MSSAESAPYGKTRSAAVEDRDEVDATVESVAGLLDANPRGLLLACPELDTWFASFTRYGNAGKSSDRARWLPLYDADPLIVDRKGSGTLEVVRAAASIVGTIQPGILARALSPEAKESGLAARLMVAYPPAPVLRWCDDSIPGEVLADYSRMIEQLLAVPLEPDDHGVPKRLPLSAEALAVSVRIGETIGASAESRELNYLRDLTERRGGSLTARELHKANRSRWPTAEAAELELDGIARAGLGRWEAGRTARRFLFNATPDGVEPG